MPDTMKVGARRISFLIGLTVISLVASETGDNWIHPRIYEYNYTKYRSSFKGALPYPNFYIDGIFQEAKLRETLLPLFDKTDLKWEEISSPLGKKFVLAGGKEYTPQEFKDALASLSTPAFVGALRRLTGIPDLEADPSFHWASIFRTPRGGFEGLHSDARRHPKTGQEKRLTMVIYLNENWDPSWGGALEFWSEGHLKGGKGTQPDAVAPYVFNRAAFFENSDTAIHGYAEPLRCPEGTARRVLTYSYISPVRPETSMRTRALFVAHPDEDPNPQLDRLRELRATDEYVDKLRKFDLSGEGTAPTERPEL